MESRPQIREIPSLGFALSGSIFRMCSRASKNRSLCFIWRCSTMTIWIGSLARLLQEGVMCSQITTSGSRLSVTQCDNSVLWECSVKTQPLRKTMDPSAFSRYIHFNPTILLPETWPKDILLFSELQGLFIESKFVITDPCKWPQCFGSS